MELIAFFGIANLIFCISIVFANKQSIQVTVTENLWVAAANRKRNYDGSWKTEKPVAVKYTKYFYFMSCVIYYYNN